MLDRELLRHDDVLMTLDDGTLFLHVVNVRNACDCLCYSQTFVGYLALIQ